MSDLAGQTTQQLFSRWRTGDATAGQAMAQRFSDWYYAISASRLGETNCRPALERACQRFAQGVASVTEAGKLADWAHKIIAEEIQMAGGRVEGGDHPNALTNQRSPTDLLQSVRGGMDPTESRLLALVYDPSQSLDVVKRESESGGGYPLAVLKARYGLKRALRTVEGVPFTEIPESPNLDWGPLPLYECGRMAQGNEEKAFETWMLSDLTLCKDIAEFAAFALALRGGAWKTASTPAVSRPAPPPPRPDHAPESGMDDAPAQGPNMVLVAGLGAAIVGVLALAAYLLLT